MNAENPIDGREQRIAQLDYDYDSRPRDRIAECNLCRGNRFVTLTHRDRYGYAAKADGCLRCGLVFLNPVMTSNAYSHFYGEVYRPLVSAYHGRRIDADSIQSEQRDYAIACGDFLESRVRHAGYKTLLDIGGSTGVVAHGLRERFDLQATVIDPAPMEIDVARKLGLKTVTGFVEDYDSGGATFDLIVLCQTIDHLLDVQLSLSKIRSLISDHGIFFVDIVDFRAAYLRNRSIVEAIKIDHPYYLVEHTMAAYLRRSGFDILAVDYAADALHIGYLCAPAEPAPDYLPAPEVVEEQWREIRRIQVEP
jgi:2-polyprenyl-3-methyl-5-hydroxy-6-metoxy-1,4-benzoquinol methylase